MNTANNIKSLLYILAGIFCIVFFASGLLFQLFFFFLGLGAINQGLKLRGISPMSFFMRAWMGRFR